MLRRLALAAAALLLGLAAVLGLWVATFDAAQYKGLAVDWMRSAHQRTLAIDGPVTLALLPRLSLKISGLRLSERGRSDEFLAVDELALALRPWPLLHRELVIDRIVARGLRAGYRRDARGRTNLDDLLGGGAAGTAAAVPATPAGTSAGGRTMRWDISEVQLADLRLRLDDAQLPLAGELVIASLTTGRLAPGAVAPLTLRAALQLQGPRPLALALDGGFDLTLQADPPALTLGALALAVTAGAAAVPLKLALGGQARADARSATWTLAGTLEGRRFDSNGQARLTGAVPELRVNARFDALDLDRLAAALAPASPPSGAATPLDGGSPPMAGLLAVDGRFTLGAGALVLHGVRLADAALQASIDGGRLRVDRLVGGVWGGRIEASGSADGHSQAVATKLVADGVDVDALLGDLTGQRLLEGRGRVRADLRSSAASMAALRSQLAGTMSLRLHDGAVKGINLARALRQARAMLSARQGAVSRASVTEKTDFTELSASARIDGGVARSDDLDLKSPFLRVAGQGLVDIGRGRVDYTARATLADTAVGQTGEDLSALRGLTVPVRFSGPFDAVDWKLQWSGLASAAARSRLEDRLSRALGLSRGGASAAGADASLPAASGPAAPARAEDLLKDRLRRLLR